MVASSWSGAMKSFRSPAAGAGRLGGIVFFFGGAPVRESGWVGGGVVLESLRVWFFEDFERLDWIGG